MSTQRPPRIIGIDPSLTSTGIAVIDPDTGIQLHRIRSKGAKTATLAARADRLSALVGSILEALGEGAGPKPDLVVIESPAYSNSLGSMHDRSGLWWMLVDALASSSIPVLEVPPTTRAKYATGRGNAAKDEVLAAVIRRYPSLEVTGNDIADALTLAAIGARLHRMAVGGVDPEGISGRVGQARTPGRGSRMTPCPTCGQPHPGCTAHTKNGARAGQPCGKHALTGQRVCAQHGGNARQNKAAAARRKDEAAARAAVATLGLPVDISPTDALLQEVQWTAGHVQWLRAKVQEVDEQNLVWGITRVKEGGDDRGTTEEAKPSAWYVLYAAERDHLLKVCAAAIKAGVEERKVRLAEQQGDLVALVIRRILYDLHLTPAQIELVPTVVPQHLRAIAMEGTH